MPSERDPNMQACTLAKTPDLTIVTAARRRGQQAMSRANRIAKASTCFGDGWSQLRMNIER